MKKFITLSLILLASTQIHAQWRGEKIKGNENVTQQSREVGEYDGVHVAGSFDVTLVSGAEGEISIEGESNLLEYIETDVKNGILKIRVSKNKNIKINWGDGIRIKVPFKDINYVSLSGSGEILSKDIINAQDFEVSISGSGGINLNVEASNTKSKVTGSGELVLQGTTQNHDTIVTGSGDLDAGKYDADNVDARVTGSGDVLVHCKSILKASITGSGDITYLGNPDKQETKVTGSGDITKG